jgi:hypothetical protein
LLQLDRFITKDIKMPPRMGLLPFPISTYFYRNNAPKGA